MTCLADPDAAKVWEECAGIAKAGKNDCGGQAEETGNSDEWIDVSKGTRTRIVGSRMALRPVAERIAQEVASNHLKLKPLEVQAADMDAIRTYFGELDFVPVDSELLASAEAELIGGRYCSIQGVTAAQLRVRGREGEGLSTLYQAPYQPDRHGDLPRLGQGETPLTLWAQGLPVRIWVEKGVLFALTGAGGALPALGARAPEEPGP